MGRSGHYAPVEIVAGDAKRAAAQLLLAWTNTAVIDAAAVLLVADGSVDSIALICQALAEHEVNERWEESEHILWVLSPAWESGEIDLPPLLRAVHGSENGSARRGAAIALDWLHIDA